MHQLHTAVPQLYVHSREVSPRCTTHGAFQIHRGRWFSVALPHGGKAQLAEAVAAVEGHRVMKNGGTNGAQEVFGDAGLVAKGGLCLG